MTIAKVGLYEGDVAKIIKKASLPIHFYLPGEVTKYGFMLTRNGQNYMIMISKRNFIEASFNIILSITGKDDKMCQMIFEELDQKFSFNFKEAPDHIKRMMQLLDTFYEEASL